MKKTLALTALVATAQASAFWGWNDGGSATDGRYTADSDLRSDYTGDAEASFSMNFSGRAKGRGDFKGRADSDSRWAGYGYDTPYYYVYPPYHAAPATTPGTGD